MNKATSKKKVSDGKKSRAKYPLPDELKELIEVVNLIPFPQKPQITSLQEALDKQTAKPTYDVNVSYYNTADDFGGLSTEDKLPSLREALKDCLQDLPDEFLEYIKVQSDFGIAHPDDSMEVVINFSSTHDVHNMASAYSWFWNIRNTLWRFVDRLERERRGEISPLYWLVFPINLPTIPYRDEKDGKLKRKGLGSLEFDDDRLRICAIKSCGRIFWAKKNTSKTCSYKCLNNYNVSQYQKLSEEEKIQRKISKNKKEGK